MPDPLVRLPTGTLEVRAQQDLHQREVTALQAFAGHPAPLAAELEFYGEPSRGALFTPDGRFVLLWTSHLQVAYRTDTLTPIFRMEAQSFTMDPVSGDVLFTQSDGIHRYDWASTPRLWLSWTELNLHDAPEWASIALSPCATRLVVHQQLFDVSTRQLITTTPRRFLLDSDYVIYDEEWEIIPTRNGAIFTASESSTFLMFDARTGETSEARQGSGLEYSPTSELIAYDLSMFHSTGRIIVERLEDGQRVFECERCYEEFFAWATSGRALLVKSVLHLSPWLLNIDTGDTCPALPQVETLTGNLYSDPYGPRVLRSQESTLELWETDRGHLLARNTDGLPARDVHLVQFLSDRLLASFSRCDAQAHLWEVSTGQHLGRFDAQDLDIYATAPLVMSADQQTITLYNRGSKLWQCAPPVGMPSSTSRIIPALSDDDALVACFPCPDNPTDFLAVQAIQPYSSTPTFALRTVLNPSVLSTLSDADLFIPGEFFYLRGDVLYGIVPSVPRKKGPPPEDHHMVVFVWKWRTGERLARLSALPPGSCATISPDGQWLAFTRVEEGPPIAYEVWDIWKQERVISIPAEQLTPHGGRCLFGPDSRTLLIGQYIFDVMTGEQRMRLPALVCEPQSASVSPNGHYLAFSSGTCAGRGAVTVFGSPERAWFAPFLDHQRKVRAAVAAGTLTEAQGQHAAAELSQPHQSVLLETWLAGQISDAFFATRYTQEP